MATHSNILGWESPQTEEPRGLQSTRSQRVGQDIATKQRQSPTCVGVAEARKTTLQRAPAENVIS